MNLQAQEYIQKLELEAHPEGGYYRRTYQNDIVLSSTTLPNRFKNNRLAASAIYFLLTTESFSAFHRLQADELWHFYAGTSVTLYLIRPNGELQTIEVGNPLKSPNATFQALIPAQTWFAAAVTAADSYALVGCTLAPAFDFEDFELANKAILMKEYPQHGELIERFVR